MKWDDFVGKPRPNRAGKKLDIFDAFFMEKNQASVRMIVQETTRARIYSDVTEIHPLAQGWGCLSSSSDYVVLVAGTSILSPGVFPICFPYLFLFSQFFIRQEISR